MATINHKYFDSIKDKIDGLQALKNSGSDSVCTYLNELMEEFDAYIKGQLEAIALRFEIIAPLIEIPTDLGEVIEWITGVIGQFTKIYNETIRLQVELMAEYAVIMAKIMNLATGLSCNITPPTAPTLPELPEVPELPL